MNTAEHSNLALRNTYCNTDLLQSTGDDNRPNTAVSPSVHAIKTVVLRENGRPLEACFAHADSAVVYLYHSSPKTHPRTVKCGAPSQQNSLISLLCAAIKRS